VNNYLSRALPGKRGAVEGHALKSMFDDSTVALISLLGQIPPKPPSERVAS